MRTGTIMVEVMLVTIILAVGAWFAIASINISGLLPTNFRAADVISERCPIHLVRPGWVAGKDQADILLNWPLAETRARLALIFMLWLVSVSGLIWRSRRNRTHGDPT